MLMKLFDYFRVYSFRETLQILRAAIGYKLYFGVPFGLRSSLQLFNILNYRNIEIKKTNELMLFKYILNNKLLNIYLKRNSSDSLVFKQIILDEEYKMVLEKIIQQGFIIENMIDAGANIGLTAIYFKTFFPSLSVICMEPNKSTQKRLIKNIATNNLKEVNVENAGLWGKSMELCGDNSFRDGLDHSYKLIDVDKHIQSNTERIRVYLL